MKPHDPKPGKRAAERSARAHLRNALGWLEGYPLGQERGEPGEAGRVRWRAYGTLEPGGPPVDIDVDRERIRASTYGLRGSRRKFPRALPRVVGDVDAWTAGVERRLEFLKAAVHDGAPLPDARALRRTGAQGSTHLETALAWALWDRPEHEPEARRRLARWRGALREVAAHRDDARELALEIALRPGAAEPLEPFRLLLADRRAWTTPLEEDGFRGRLERTLRGCARAGDDRLAPFLEEGLTRPEARLGHRLVGELLRRPGETELRALGALLPGAQLEAWSAWWSTADGVERGARSALTRALLHDRALRAELARVEKECMRRFDDLPVPLTPWELERAQRIATQFAARCDPAVAHVVLEAWEAVPDGPPVDVPGHRGLSGRALVAERWTRALLGGLAPKRAGKLARAQLALLREHAGEAVELAARAFTGVALEYEPDVVGTRPALREAFVATLGELARRGELGAKALLEIESLDIEVLPFLTETRDPVRAANLVQAWQDGDSGPGWPDERLLARLCGEDVFDAAFWREGGKLDWDSPESKSLLRAARDERARNLFRECLKDGEQRRLRDFARLHRAATALAQDASIVEPPCPAVDEDEFGWLPEPLRDAARELQARVGGRSLDRALREDVMRPERLEAEVAALETKLPAADPRRAPHLRERLEMLRARAAAPAALPPARLEACRARLERRVRRARLAAWTEVLQTVLNERLPAGLAPPEDRTEQEIMTSLADLCQAERDLGWRLLALRGTAGVDLRDEPANAAWQERMEAHGLDLAPWLSPKPGPEVVSPKGRTLRFAFETDPLEIFQMGRWFGTCLSPGDMNFFSTVAVAADLNKRVLIARDPRGTPQVRCLFALTRRGDLLAFHVYAHEEGAWARERVHAIAVEVASAVGTRLVPAGQVETLVAPAWYDDGPVDLTGRLGQFQGDGPLVAEIRAAEPGELPRILVEALGRELLDCAIEQIVTHRVFTEDPVRLVALGPLLRDRPLSVRVTLEVAGTVAELDPDFARELLLRFLRRRRGRLSSIHDSQLVLLARLLLACDEPGRALRVVRQVEDPRPDAEHAAVDALLRLRRPAQARERLRKLARSGDEGARKWLAKLEA